MSRKRALLSVVVLLFAGGMIGVCLGHMLVNKQETLTEEHKPAAEKAEAQPAAEEKVKKEQETSALEAEKEDTEIQAKIVASLEEQAEQYLEQMNLEEKVAQLFVITPDALTGVGSATAAGPLTKEAFWQYPVGGLVYFEGNLISHDQTSEMLKNIQTYSEERIGLPAFLAVDEEGGTVTRISGRGFDVPYIENMQEVGLTKDYERAEEIGYLMGEYLSDLGFNMDFAPCADVLTNSGNTVVSKRSFGSDPAIVSEMVSRQMKALKDKGVIGVPKHFPGHGATSGDSHNGYAYTDKSIEELRKQELAPFERAIREGAAVIMVGHIACPAVTGDDVPASLSGHMISRVLKEEMGFEGLVITDALNMGAIQQYYTAAETAVMALEAGVDLLLMPADFQSAYAGVVQAVRSGAISEKRIDESLRKIIKCKLQLASPEELSAETKDTQQKAADLRAYEAGSILEREDIREDSLASYFQDYPITESVYERIDGNSYVENDDIGIDELRYMKVLHYNFEHQIQVGEMIVNARLTDDFKEIFRELFEQEYEIQSMFLIDNYWTGEGDTSDTASIEVNNTSAFCYRAATGSESLSNHAYGCAIDINPQQNPYVSYDETGNPSWTHDNADPYIDRTSGAKHMITYDDLCYQLFTEHGFTWGGDWANPRDYQHFEKRIY